MQYISLDSGLKDLVEQKNDSYEAYRFVKVKMEDGRTYSAELMNGKKLKMVEDIDVEKISDIEIR